MTTSELGDLQQLEVSLTGQVQGVGLRPFIFRLAHHYQQTGYVANTLQGVLVVLQGSSDGQRQFLHDLQRMPPANAELRCISQHYQPISVAYSDFAILDSLPTGSIPQTITPDLAPCPACQAELSNPESRFYRYPFISCCDCGPRYSILRHLAFDRANTAMADFPLCHRCEAEYLNPDNRRFHAQTLSCPQCGPQLRLVNREDTLLAEGSTAITLAVNYLDQGGILALKGIGGYQLCVDASNQTAVTRLRKRKQRLHKPFAIMVTNIVAALQLCEATTEQQALLQSPQRPILLLKALAETVIAPSVAPDSDWLGLMLPASGLHELLAKDFGKPLVVTSGNSHGLPLCTDDTQALTELSEIADFWLIHNRRIERSLDDSVVKMIAGEPSFLRLGRGYAPLSLAAPGTEQPVLAVGGHFSNSVALHVDQQLIHSQYYGDLNNSAMRAHWELGVQDLQHLWAVHPQIVLHDRHPDYFSSQFAQNTLSPSFPVTHHYAHILACMAEHQLKPPLLGFAWDGIGLADDGSLCGSESLLIHNDGYQRLAHLRDLPLIGGDKASQDIDRLAFAALESITVTDQVQHLACLQRLPIQRQQSFRQMLTQNLNCPPCSSMGRLFDTVASLLNIADYNHFQGQAAIKLEQLANRSMDSGCYSFTLDTASPNIIDWRPMIRDILNDLPTSCIADIAARFHNTLARIILQIAQQSAVECVVLSGGCFQNARLTEQTCQQLHQYGFKTFIHRKLPSNDSSLAIGQLYAHALKKTVTFR